MPGDPLVPYPTMLPLSSMAVAADSDQPLGMLPANTVFMSCIVSLPPRP